MSTRSVRVAKCGHQWEDVLLKQGLSSSDLDKRTLEGLHLSKHLMERSPGALIKGVLCVAVTAP